MQGSKPCSTLLIRPAPPTQPAPALEFTGNSRTRNNPATWMHYARDSDMLF